MNDKEIIEYIKSGKGLPPLEDKKVNVYLDFDDTLVNSIEAATMLLNREFIKTVDPNDIKRWDFTDQFTEVTLKEVEDVFASEEFFYLLQEKPYAKQLVEELNKIANVVIISKGTPKNLELKEEYIKENFGDVKFVGLPIGVSKSNYMKKRCIIVDDNVKYLDEACAVADIPILYRQDDIARDYNADWKGIKIIQWCPKSIKIMKKLVENLK